MASDGSGEEEDILYVWEARRGRTIQSLRTLADELDYIQGNVNIARLTGSSTAIVSGVGTLACLALSPFTGGLSAMALVGFGGVGILSGVVSIGTLIGKYFREKGIMENVQQAINEDRETTERLNEEMNEREQFVAGTNVNTMEVAGAVGRCIKAPVAAGGKAAAGACSVGAEATRVGTSVARCAKAAQGARAVGAGACTGAKVIAAEAGGVLGRSGQVMAAEAAREAGGAMGGGAAIGARAVSKVGAAFIFVLLPFDIHEFVVTSIDTYNGSVHESAKQIRNLANELETEMANVVAVYRAWRGDLGMDMRASLLRSGVITE